jgi:S1-C subfamily serine protease
VEAASDVDRWGAAVVTVLTPTSTGTGFHVAPSGYIVTCAHVVQGQRDLRIRLRSGDVRHVTSVVLEDEARDLAVLRADVGTLPAVVLGDSDRVKAGDAVTAIGSPVGLEQTVTQGIVSQVRRMLGGVTILQTQTPVSPGNSGGPLFDATGAVVGIISFKHKGGENLNFAVGVNELHRLLGTTPTATAPPPAATRQAEGGGGAAPPDVARYKIRLADGRVLPAEAYRETGDQIVIERANTTFAIPRSSVVAIEDRADGKVIPMARPGSPPADSAPPGLVQGPALPTQETQDPASLVLMKSGSQAAADRVWIENEWVVYERRGIRNKVHAANVLVIMDVELERRLAACNLRFDQAKYRVRNTERARQQLLSESEWVYERAAIRRAARHIIEMELAQAQAQCDRFLVQWSKSRDQLHLAANPSAAVGARALSADMPPPQAPPPVQPKRVGDPECLGEAFEVRSDEVRVIQFNLVEVPHQGKRLVVDLDELMGNPPMSLPRARTLLEDVLRTGRNKVALRGGDTPGRARGTLCVNERNIVNHPALEQYRASR